MGRTKKIMISVFVLLVFLFTSVSCTQVKELTGNSSSKTVAPLPTESTTLEQKVAGQEETLAENEDAAEDISKSKSETKSDRLIIRQKSISMQVKDVRKTYKKIDQTASKYKGRIISASISSEKYQQNHYPETLEEKSLPPAWQNQQSSKNNAGPLYATIVVKVPSDETSAALKDLKKLGKIEDEQESEEEVTDQYVDLNARLKNLQRTEERYLDFFDAAKTVEDMLKIEEQLTRVRGEIESIQAQVDHLEKSAKLGTITIYLHEPTQITKPIRDWGFIKAVLQGIQNFITVVNFLVMTFGALLPFLILILFLLLIIKLVLRMKRGTA